MTIKKRYKKSELIQFTINVLKKVGLNKLNSTTVAELIIRADERGVWSHGIVRLPVYVKRIEKRSAKINPSLKFKKITNNISHLSGDNGLGYIAASAGINKCVSLAKKNGIGLVAIKGSNHFGMAANYLEVAAKNKCMAWVFTNASKALPPHGAMAPFFGTSPFAFGCPTKNIKKPFILDMASSSVARGKLKFAAQNNIKIPFGYALDKFGKPTNDGAKAFEGIMLPFGGMKGAGLSWMMDIVAGIFTGANHSGKVKNAISDFSGASNVGHLMICLRTDLFQSHSSFIKKIEFGIKEVKKLKKAKGFEKILHPGEPEFNNEIVNSKRGIWLSIDTIKELEKLSIKYNVKSPFKI